MPVLRPIFHAIQRIGLSRLIPTTLNCRHSPFDWLSAQ